MLIDITEEEREFLERVCSRAKMFCLMHKKGTVGYSKFERDLDSIESLIRKLSFPEQNLKPDSEKSALVPT